MPEEPAAKVEAPQTLYKYMTLNTAYKVFESGCLRFSSPIRFNDPFDCQWNPFWWIHDARVHKNLHESLTLAVLDPTSLPTDCSPDAKRMFEQASIEILKVPTENRRDVAGQFVRWMLRPFEPGRKPPTPLTDQLIRSYRILSLSARPDSMLMWSHYSDQHSGVVLGFNATRLQNSWQLKAMKVKYTDMWPKADDPVKAAEAITFDREVPLPEPVSGTQLPFLKAEDWKYEQEWRFLFIAEQAGELYTNLPFPASALTHVIIGARSPIERWHWLPMLARSTNAMAKLYLAKKHLAAFRLEFNPLGWAPMPTPPPR